MTGTDNPFYVSDVDDESNYLNEVANDLNETDQSVENDSFITDEEDVEDGYDSFNSISDQSVFLEPYTSTPISHHELGNLHASLSRVKRRLFASYESLQVKIYL